MGVAILGLGTPWTIWLNCTPSGPPVAAGLGIMCLGPPGGPVVGGPPAATLAAASALRFSNSASDSMAGLGLGFGWESVAPVCFCISACCSA